jgi:hypothetical protein
MDTQFWLETWTEELGRNPGIVGIAVLKGILSVVGCELDSSGLGMGLVVDFCAQNSELLGSIKGKEILC